ncbi:aldo/keto reductase [Ramlibacter rhizophilus]|uniref:Aldo/keto reductase n=1 Tax=Ramlibacter rhizophilus TaxID=1781167 RepID=A0A4Z0C0W5_9BURK|nr:aldo/keto reductase [Ramlibacter rhizophilus]TFZ04444.1 aldo/keto reductase [Ramlibacter rhizophilus]
MKHVTLPCGEAVAALGQGTWHLGDDPARRREEIASIRRGIDLGMTLIDTAEMYGEGRAEALVGEAIEGRRDEVFIVSKVYPHNASRRSMPISCDNSLNRLRVDAIDLYLLHWQGAVPLAETVEAFEALRRAGKIRHWGVSNLDTALMRDLYDVPAGAAVQTDQVLYNLSRRGIEWDLLPWLRERRIPVMAYSPLEEGRLLRRRGLVEFAKRHGMTPAQVAIAWLLARDDVIAIPKTGNRTRLEENARSLEHRLTTAQLQELDALFPPPTRASPLEMI